jgi:hypothetical protein
MEELIKYDDESLERYIQMAKSEDSSVREILLTVLENNFDYKYAALYVYLLQHITSKIETVHYPKLSKCLINKMINASPINYDSLRGKKENIEHFSFRTFFAFNVTALEVIKAVDQNEEDELFSPCAIKILSRFLTDGLNRKLKGLSRFQCKIEKITLNE